MESTIGPHSVSDSRPMVAALRQQWIMWSKDRARGRCGVRCGSLWRLPRRWQWLSNDDGSARGIAHQASLLWAAIKTVIKYRQLLWHAVRQCVNSPVSGRPDAEDSGATLASRSRVCPVTHPQRVLNSWRSTLSGDWGPYVSTDGVRNTRTTFGRQP